ncbi:2'-5' RNA ligase superfamily protein [Pseudonocardia sediminis]|uniref:2'-5' RNA ligase superfamily protein n=1 Tax=Pseudonocardia sediminis TaxID=1397368 RepID=A0A4Q7V8A2_PSEST|nr:2'-5' RNA ligase family protein [Pseudonocardia sediminis]RZT89063.1 2'-5' RNA ligase superfamily protein [Pseudonocardia sediminis]
MADRPLILTALLEESAQEHFDDLRRRHFPSDRNHLAAHLTLFHHLPGDQEPAVDAAVAEATERPPLTARVSAVRLLGRGVAFDLRCPELTGLRRDLAARWEPWLTRQDSGKSDLHVTVQNKVTPAAARSLYDDLSAGFEPYDVPVVGLALWHYLGGPWSEGPRHLFDHS